MNSSVKFVSTTIIRNKNGLVVPLVMLFDMWDDGTGTKQLGVYLCYPDSSGDHPIYFLLCCTPLIDETNCTGDNQIVTINKALESFHLGWADILLIIADNTSVNPSIAKKVKKPIIGCQSHVLALAVKEYCKEHISLLVKMHDLCKMFRTAKYRGALRREGCDVNPKIVGHKWGATYNMLETYFDDVGVFIESIVRADVFIKSIRMILFMFCNTS